MLPSMWRVELFHPLTVHFPIALLIVGAALRMWAVVYLRARYERQWAVFIYGSAQLLNLIGVLFGWAAYVTGTLAEEEVNSVLCDPTITHMHGDYALYVTLIFTGVALFDALAYMLAHSRVSFDTFSRLLRSWAVRFLFAVIALGGAGLLGYVGHLGASLTYQQGAAVHKPAPECTEFE